MIHQKRLEFQKQLRRRQIDSIFDQKRNHFLQEMYKQQTQLELNSDIRNEFLKMISLIEMSIAHKVMPQVSSIFNKLLELAYKEPESLEHCLFGCSKTIALLIKKAIINTHSLQEQFQWVPLPQEQHVLVIQQIMTLLHLLNYKKCQLSSFEHLAHAFWQIFLSDLLSESNKSAKIILELVLKVLRKVLNSQQVEFCKRLKELGVGFQITRIIEYSSKALSSSEEEGLMQIIESYLSQESGFLNRNQNKEGGVDILGMENEEKIRLLGYSLHIVHTRKDLSYQALSAICKIIERHEYLSETISDYSLKDLLSLLTSHSRGVQLKSIELINDLVYCSREVASKMLEGNSLPDQIYKVLVRQNQSQDDFYKDLIYTSMIILSNLTLVEEKHVSKIKEKFMSHPIWQLAFESMNPACRLFPLVGVFEYYFDALKRKQVISILDSYFCALSEIDMKYIPEREKQNIKKTVIRLYMKVKDHWPANDEQNFFRALQSYKLEPFLEEIISMEEQH